MNRQEIIEREARLRPWAAFCAVAALVLYMVGSVMQAGASPLTTDLPTEYYRWIDENEDQLLYSNIAGAIGFALLLVPLVYLFRAAQARSERVNGLFLGIVVLGPILLGVQAMLLWVAQADVASQFVAQSAGVGDIYTLLDNLLSESGALSAAQSLILPALLSLIFAMVYTSLWAMRTGLSTRFFATTGMVVGALFIFLPLLLFSWFLYLALVILGRIPNGRPPAWDAGEAIPWPAPGEEQLAAAGVTEVVEGDATEIPGVDENPNAARRERAKKRKRKRRR